MSEILKTGVNLHWFQIQINDNYLNIITFSVFNITAHGYIFIEKNSYYIFLLNKQATFLCI